MASARNQQQPSFDFLTGGSPPRPSRRESTYKPSQIPVRADINNEQLRAQLNTLQYELDTLKQERELQKIEWQSEVREAEKRAEADFKRAQAAETERNAALKRLDALSREHSEAQSRAVNERTGLERKIRSLQEQAQGLREEFEDVQAEILSQERRHKHSYGELEQRHAALQTSVQDVQDDLNNKVETMHAAQQKTAQKEREVGELENEILRLKAQTGDADTLGVIKRELSEQVAHIKRLEGVNREQSGELKSLRKAHKAVEVVEEEKRTLLSRVKMMDDLRKELAEAQLQKQILEDERRSWTSYLESQSVGNEQSAYSSPEEMAKAFVAERMERANLMERLGALQPEIKVREESVRNLEQEKASLSAELQKAKAADGGSSNDSKAKARLERQKNLAIKEVEYLRAQIRSLDEETTEFDPDKAAEGTTQRIQELEGLVDQYRTELQTMQKDLSNMETKASHPPQPTLKRSHEDDADERLGELRRKMRSMQDDLSQLHSRNTTLETDLKANVSQLTALRESWRTRVLEFRDNPTAQAETIKMTTLKTLREENAALLSQVRGQSPSTKVVPISTLENIKLQMADLETQLAQRDTKIKRLKSIWNAKHQEFAAAVASTFGWNVSFMSNGRFKVTSILYPTHMNREGEEEENSILFDGEQGTMKVSGGARSLFESEIRPLIEFWVDEKKEVPCFLAACTLEFYDKSTRAARA